MENPPLVDLFPIGKGQPAVGDYRSAPFPNNPPLVGGGNSFQPNESNPNFPGANTGICKMYIFLLLEKVKSPARVYKKISNL